jgi:hypothetical protein
MEPKVRTVTTRDEYKNRRTPAERKYTRLQVLLSGDLLVSAGFKKGSEFTAERIADGEILVKRIDRKRKKV